jgi:hypothetical protein
VALWHSRLPKVDKSNMVRTRHLWCLGAEHGGRWYAVAIWTNPVARLLNDQPLLELRRLAIANDAPVNTASRTLGIMARMVRKKFPTIERLISYQDCDVHAGTIYAAAGWTKAAINKNGGWDRPNRKRGDAQAPGQKIRWEKQLAKNQMERAA